jgi:molybdopterin synthase sulfur carrier subunit
MSIRVLFFAQLAEITNTKEIVMERTETTGQLIKNLQQKFPSLKNSVYLIAVEKEIIHADTALFDHSVVALLPPYSGG